MLSNQAHDFLSRLRALSKVLYESQAADMLGVTRQEVSCRAAAAADDTIDAEFEVKQDDE